MTILKPMLAPNDAFDPELCSWPKLGSVKLDGFRTFNQGAYGAVTRSGKPIANKATSDFCGDPEFNGFDGELIVGAWNDPKAFDNTNGPLRRHDGDPGARWYLFDDRTDMRAPFEERLELLQYRVQRGQEAGDERYARLEVIEHKMIESLDDLTREEAAAVAMGFEGYMLKCPFAEYKNGRATLKQDIFIKVKRYSHEEAIIVRLEEQMHNGNEAFTDTLGNTARSEKAEGLIPSGMVGSFWLKSDKYDEEFKVSAGSMTHAEKLHAMQNPHLFVGQFARYKFFEHGTKNAPRQGIFDGIRAPEDIGRD